MNHFLIVDDDARFRATLDSALSRRQFKCTTAGSVAEAKSLLPEHRFSHAILDLRLPGEDGLELIEPLLRLEPAMKVLILTGFGSIPTAVEAVRRGACNFLTKPVGVEEILQGFNSPVATPGFTQPSLAEVERDYIQRVLDSCSGNITKAAKILGLHRRSLQRKLPPKSV